MKNQVKRTRKPELIMLLVGVIVVGVIVGIYFPHSPLSVSAAEPELVRAIRRTENVEKQVAPTPSRIDDDLVVHEGRAQFVFATSKPNSTIMSEAEFKYFAKINKQNQNNKNPAINRW
jgi:hypothetical protein